MRCFEKYEELSNANDISGLRAFLETNGKKGPETVQSKKARTIVKEFDRVSDAIYKTFQHFVQAYKNRLIKPEQPQVDQSTQRLSLSALGSQGARLRGFNIRPGSFADFDPVVIESLTQKSFVPYVVKLACVIFALAQLGNEERVAPLEAFLARIGARIGSLKRTFYENEVLVKWQRLCLDLCQNYSPCALTTFVYKIVASTDLLDFEGLRLYHDDYQ